MKSPVALTTVLVLGLLLSACATEEQTQPMAETQSHAAAALTLSQVSAMVEAIDLATRMVTLVRPDGKGFVLQAGEQVRNLDQVQISDKVTVEYYEGLVAEIGPPGASMNNVQVTEAMGRAAPGERPAGAIGNAISATVVIEYVDTIRNVAHFRGPLGQTHIVKVMKPQFRTMLKKLRPGDKVALTYFEAVAVSVKPASN